MIKAGFIKRQGSEVCDFRMKKRKDCTDTDCRDRNLNLKTCEFWQGLTVGMSIMALWVMWLQ